MCANQDPETVSQGLAQTFGDWSQDVALTFPHGDQDLQDAMANPDAPGKILDLLEELASVQRLRNTLATRPPLFTITFGRWEDNAELMKAFFAAGHNIDDYVREIPKFNDFALVEGGTYEFVKATVSEVMGDDQDVRVDVLLDTALRLGWIKAPFESAIAIALTDSYPLDEPACTVLSEQLEDSDGDGVVLRVERDSVGNVVVDIDFTFDLLSGKDMLLLCRKVQQAQTEA